MASSEREDAKKGIVRREREDPEFDTALTDASRYQLEVTKEKNRHAQETQKTNLGWFGRLAGGPGSAPVFIAAIVALISLLGGLFCWNSNPDLGKTMIGLTASAMSYLFGRGSRA
jgi:hypothetical protein